MTELKKVLSKEVYEHLERMRTSGSPESITIFECIKDAVDDYYDGVDDGSADEYVQGIALEFIDSAQALYDVADQNLV